MEIIKTQNVPELFEIIDLKFEVNRNANDTLKNNWYIFARKERFCLC